MSDFLIAFTLIFILLGVIIILQAKILKILKRNCKAKEESEKKQDLVEKYDYDENVVPAIICAINEFESDGDFVVRSIKQVDNACIMYSVLNTISGDE